MSTRRVLCLVMTLVGFGLRVHDLGATSLRWDEGWSIALARLPLVDMLRLTALDVHPPLYYLVLGPWLRLAGSHEVALRFMSVAAGTAAVPLAAWAAARWWPAHAAPAGAFTPNAARHVPLLAALYAALAPALVYYGGVARMYALTTPFLLAATGNLGRLARVPPDRPAWRRALVAFVVAAAAALHTFYYTAFALAGLLTGALIRWPRRWRQWLAAGALLSLAALPWLAYALPLLAARVEGQTAARGGFHPAAALALIPAGWQAALLAERWTALATGIPLAVLLAAPALARRRDRRAGWAGMAGLVLAVLATLAGAASGAQGHMFAARYAIGATPFVALALAWSVAALWGRSAWLGALALAAVIGITLPTLGGYVYAKTAEVTDAFDPSSDWRALHGRTDAGDVVVFNILSLAGLYDRYRTPRDPPWSYAQLWDPVHEPLALAVDRVASDARRSASGRFWLALYKGTVSADSAGLKSWADGHYFPGLGWWQGDALYQSYIAAPIEVTNTVTADFDRGVRLDSAAFTERSGAGRGIAVRLTWLARRPPDGNAQVFVHAYGADGRLVAQHDGVPVNGSRQTSSWTAGERLDDLHGLWVPPSVTDRRLRLVAGLYDPASGERWRVAGGADRVELGWVALAER